ncbi:MAG TPA: hypothetical protein VE076_08390 [Nitrososphaeraceae archaeon]|nr:hypothetical protein [Nitrososphaeraceae archaeon]
MMYSEFFISGYYRARINKKILRGILEVETKITKATTICQKTG